MCRLVTIILLFTVVVGYGQKGKGMFTGRYADDVTELIIHADRTFELKTPDYVYPYTFTVYQNRGVWIDSGNVLTLNPDKEKRGVQVHLSERVIRGSDSIEIKINYLTELYEQEVLVGQQPFDFERLTLYINKRRHYHNVVHKPIIRICAFAPRVKKQIVVDSSNTFRLPKTKVERLGMFTYGFERVVELKPLNPEANYFEVTIIQSIDKERTPRSKRVIIKGKYAYYYEQRGKIPTSGAFISGLKRVE